MFNRLLKGNKGETLVEHVPNYQSSRYFGACMTN